MKRLPMLDQLPANFARKYSHGGTIIQLCPKSTELWAASSSLLPFLHSSLFPPNFYSQSTLWTSSTTSFPCSFSFSAPLTSYFVPIFSFLASFHLLFVLSSLTHHLSRWLSPLPSLSLYTPLLRCTSPLSSHSDPLAIGNWAPALTVSFWGYWVHYFPVHPHPVQLWRFKVPLVSVPSLNIARTTTARGCNSSP